MLKENSVLDLWNKTLKDVDLQEDKQSSHHFWSNILHDMTDWEWLLNKIFVEKKRAEEEKEAEKEREAADEQGRGCKQPLF